VAMDDREKVTKAVYEIRTHFPNTKIIARARNRPHLFDLLAEKVDFAERETVRGGLAMGRKALTYLGFTEDSARELSDTFLEMDFQIAMDAYEMRDDMDALVSKAKEGRILLEKTLSGDAKFISQDESKD